MRLGNMSTTKTPEETRSDIGEVFAKWRIDEYRILRDSKGEWGAARVIYYLNDQAHELKCDRFSRYADNLRSIWQILDALRKAQDRGILRELAKAAIGLLNAGEPKRRPWYEVFTVSPQASDAVVEATYKALARERHPDTGGETGAMAELNAAYEEYKATRHQANGNSSAASGDSR